MLLAIGAVVALPLVLSAYLGSAPDRALFRVDAGRRLLMLSCGLARTVSLRPRHAGGEVALAQRRQPVCGVGVAGRICAVSFYLCQLRRLQRDLRLARRRHRLDDVDVDLDDRGADRRGAQSRDRASDRARHTDGRHKPLGARGAVMADTVGEAKT